MSDVSQLITFQRDYIAGIDIGQVQDATAVAIIERVRPAARPGLHHGLVEQAKDEARRIATKLELRHLERIPLGTPYPEQVQRLRELLQHPRIAGVQTYLDATGVGLGPFQMLKREGVRDLHAIKITGSTGPAKRVPGGWNVGKAELVNAVQIEMQTGRLGTSLEIPGVPELVHELREFRSRQSASGNVTFNAREGTHDDLVLAVSYAVFGALRPIPVTTIDVRFPA